MAKPYKPTRKDFEQFEAEFLRCVDILSLTDWNITFLFDSLDQYYADMKIWSHNFLATATLNNSRIDDISQHAYDPKRIARHEVGHLFHARLQYIGKERYVRPDDFVEESERLARVMETLLEP